jgi:sulfur relay (sulfurtransferase) DsrF/TusC family protein
MIAIMLRKPPYGSIDAAEAVRYALGGISEGMRTALILIDGGVLAARAGQEAAPAGFAEISAAIADAVSMGVEVYAEKTSLRREHLEPEEMIEGIKVVNGIDIASIVGEAKTAFIF